MDTINRITEEQLNAQAQYQQLQEEEYNYNSELLARAQYYQNAQNQSAAASKNRRKHKKNASSLRTLAKYFGVSGGLALGFATAGGTAAKAAVLLNHLT